MTRKPSPLTSHPNAIDAPVQIARAGRGRPRHGTWPEHYAGPGDATWRIVDVLAVHHCLRWCWTESNTGKPSRTLAAIPATVTEPIERCFFVCMGVHLTSRACELNGDGSRVHK